MCCLCAVLCRAVLSCGCCAAAACCVVLCCRSWTNASHYFRTTYEAAGLADFEDVSSTRNMHVQLLAYFLIQLP